MHIVLTEKPIRRTVLCTSMPCTWNSSVRFIAIGVLHNLNCAWETDGSKHIV